jgi:hypothetical protein
MTIACDFFTSKAEGGSLGTSNSLFLSPGEWPRLTSTARINDPSKLARFSSHGMAPVLVPLRQSSEHILIVRAPGARDQRGCHSVPFHRARSASKEGTWPLPPHPSEAARCASTGIVPATPSLFQRSANRSVVRSGPMGGSARGLSPVWLV